VVIYRDYKTIDRIKSIKKPRYFKYYEKKTVASKYNNINKPIIIPILHLFLENAGLYDIMEYK
jgi:hypothetical protein